MANNNFELTANEAIEEVRSWESTGEGECEVVGAIFDQDEAVAFLEWLMSDEARAIGQRLRESSDE